MVIRFHKTALKAAELRKAVYASYVATTGLEGFVENGIQYTPFTIKEHIHLTDSFDLFIDDACEPEVTGIFMQAMRAHGFLAEDADVIVPRVYTDTTKYVPPAGLDLYTPCEKSNIERFEDHLPEFA